MPSCVVRPSVRLSITFVYSVETNKHIFIFFTSGSDTIPVFLHQTSWQYSDGDLPYGDDESRWGRQKSRFPTSNWLHRVLWTLRPVRFLSTRRRQTMSSLASCDTDAKLVDGGKRRRNVYDKKSQRHAKTTEQHLIAHSDKPIVYVTSDKRLLTHRKHRAAYLRQQS